MVKSKDNTLLIIIAIGVIGFFIFSSGAFAETDQFIETNLFDANGNLISGNTQAVVDGVQGVAFVTFTINIENLDTVELTFSVDSMTPVSIDSAKPSGTITVAPTEIGSAVTDLIDIEPFGNSMQEFCVTVKSEPIPALREEGTKTGCVTLDIQPNPQGTFDVVVESDGLPPTINPGCTESWQCSEYGSCVGDLETRECTDINSCGTVDNMPDEERACVADNVNFRAAEAVGFNLPNYRTISSCGYDQGNNWVSYTNSCGSVLGGYGYRTTVSISSGTCDGNIGVNFDEYLFNVPYARTASCNINGDGNGQARLYRCDLDFPNSICICEDDVDGDGINYARFQLNNGEDFGNADTSQISVDPTLENSC